MLSPCVLTPQKQQQQNIEIQHSALSKNKNIIFSTTTHGPFLMRQVTKQSKTTNKTK